MMQKYTLFFLVGLMVTCVACSDSENKKATWISGEIVNPQDSIITLFRNNKLIDTIFLNAENRFHYKFDAVKEGLYKFRHHYETHYETQMFYIERGDSLLLRLNTREFDNSLMYSGEGAEANNFLIKLFLDNRENSSIFLRYYDYEPLEFMKVVDSIGRQHLGTLRALYNADRVSRDFVNLVKTIVDYIAYDFYERYYFLVNKYNHKLKKQLPDDFFAYRDAADYNNKDLQTYYLYQYFLNDYLKNKSVAACLSKSGNRSCFDLESDANLTKRLELSDSLFQLKSLRAHYLTHFAAQLIVHAHSKSKVDSVLAYLKSVAFDPSKFAEVEALASVQKRQFIGNISHLQLVKPNDQVVEIADILSKPTVFYYWSVYYKAHHLAIHHRVAILRKRYPALNFVGINIDNKHFKLWKSGLAKFAYRKGDEFQLVCPVKQQQLYRNYLNKMVFVNAEGQIIANDLDVHGPRLEEKLLGLLNR